jgi:prepilin peptidase CpaA
MQLLSSSSIEFATAFQWGVVIISSLVAVVGDVRERRIPNKLTFPLLAGGLIWSAWLGGVAGLGEALGACFLLAVPYVLLFLYAGGGAGDAKLMGAIGAWLGIRQSVSVLLFVASAGLVLSLAKAIKERRLKVVLTNILLSLYTFMLCVAGGRRPALAEGPNEQVEQADRLEVPYGVAIAAGVCVAAIVTALCGKEWLPLW